jgi:hypothetical protein
VILQRLRETRRQNKATAVLRSGHNNQYDTPMSNIISPQPNVTTKAGENCDCLHRDDANHMQESGGRMRPVSIPSDTPHGDTPVVKYIGIFIDYHLVYTSYSSRLLTHFSIKCLQATTMAKIHMEYWSPMSTQKTLMVHIISPFPVPQ